MSDPDEPDNHPQQPGEGDSLGPQPRRRRRREEFDYQRDRDTQPASRGMAVAGLILGVLSLVTGFLAGIPAIICSVIAMNRPGSKGMATTGVILGTVGTTVCTIPLLIALLLPAVQKVREAAARAKESNNLKQIVLGAANYDITYGRIPPATENLSWRVHILPFMEQQNLYMQFNLKQEWDSPTNREIANIPVNTYMSPEDPPGTNQTHYRVFVGPQTLYDRDNPVKSFSGIIDGTSNTIFAIESTDTVPWPQPKELEYTPNRPLPEVGHRYRDVVLIAMADGSVRIVKKNALSPMLLRALITPSGGEIVPRDW